MKYQEALDFLTSERDALITGNDGKPELCSELLQELVDKETPKKPKILRDEDMLGRKFQYIECPHCRMFISNPLVYRCNGCGGRLDWSGVNE